MREENFPRFLLQSIVFVAGLIVISGCAGDSTDTAGAGNTESRDAAASLVDVRVSQISREKNAAPGANLIDLQGSWHGWTGEQSTIRYDPQTERLRIAAPENDTSVSFGVRRFDIPLVTGNWYALQVDAGGTDAGAMIFLFDTNGIIAPALTDANGSLMLATETSPLSFNAPSDTAGFYLQVQSGYQTPNAAVLAAAITTGSHDITRPIPDGELISIENLWPLWNGEPGQVAYEPENQRLRIDASDDDGGNAIGAQRLGFGLQAGNAYQLSALQASDARVGVLLFLFDSQHRVIPFSGDVNHLPWLATSPDNPQTFVAPAGVADIGIQVQGGFEPMAESFVVPSLLAVTNQDLDPSQTPVSPPTTPVPERPVPTPDE